MNFYPCSRYLLVKTIREESVEEEQRVLLPEGYTPSKKEFGAYMVVSAAPEVALSVFSGGDPPYCIRKLCMWSSFAGWEGRVLGRL
jgi:hypothetical protein